MFKKILAGLLLAGTLITVSDAQNAGLNAFSVPSILSDPVSIPYSSNVTTYLNTASNNTYTVNMTEVAPAAPTLALVTDGTGTVTAGSHVCQVTYKTATGETQASPSSGAVTADASHTKITVTFTTGSSVVTGRNIYCSKAGTVTPLFLVVASPVVANNSATTYTLNTADASFQATTAPLANTTSDARVTVTNAGNLSAQTITATNTLTVGGLSTFNNAVTFNGNGNATFAQISTNLNTGAAALSTFQVSNSSTSGALSQTSTGYNNGIAIYKSDQTLLEGDGTNGMLIVTGSSTPIVIAPNRVVAITITGSQQVKFNNVATTANAANGYLDSGDSNNLLRSTSSVRYKTNIIYFDATKSGKIIDNLKPILYTSLASADDPLIQHYGLLAEDVAKIVPEIVNWVSVNQIAQNSRVPDGYSNLDEYFTANAVNGKVPDSVQYDRLVPLLVAEIKSLRARVAVLEAK